jgi:hypothetical protein
VVSSRIREPQALSGMVPRSNASAIHADVPAAWRGAPSYPHCKGARGVADEMPVRQRRRGLRRPSRASVEALFFERNPSRACVSRGGRR